MHRHFGRDDRESSAALTGEERTVLRRLWIRFDTRPDQWLSRSYKLLPDVLLIRTYPRSIRCCRRPLSEVRFLLEEAGLSIPDDVSLVGYDNNRMAALRHISLTTIDQPGEDMGRSAVDRLTERISGTRTEPSHEVVAPSLVVRATTGPPRFDR